jgi:hypothetical protein
MGKRLLRRRGLAAAGVLAAGVFTGCQSPNQFIHTGVARGDLAGSSPAFSAAPRMPAERILSATPGAGGMMVVSADPAQPMTVTSVPANQVVDSAPLMTNSGDVVSQPGSPTPAAATPVTPAPAMTVQAGATLPPMSMAAQTMAVPPMPVQAITVHATGMTATMQQAAIPGTPVTTTMAMPATPIHGTGTPILMLIQGPNGPQYVITEVLSVVPLPAPTATPAPIPAPMPAPVSPVTMSAPVRPSPVMPASATMPEPGPAPAVMPVALPPVEPGSPVKAAPDPMPTLTAPPPAMIPPPSLPPTVSMKPSTGPALPSMEASGAAVTQAGGPKLPPAAGAMDDDIPAAPVFLPVAK